jgi:hypothetical protein
VSYKNSIVVRLYFRIAESFQISIKELYPIFTTASNINTLIGMFFKKRGDIELVFFDSYFFVAVPIEHSENGSFMFFF